MFLAQSLGLLLQLWPFTSYEYILKTNMYNPTYNQL